MAYIQLKSEINVELDQLLAGVEQLDTHDLEQFLMQIRYVLAHRKSSNLPTLEIELIQRINQTLPNEIQQQYNDLRAKMRSGNITPMEHQDLLKLVDIVEQADGDRLQYLVQLSQLRNISVSDLMKQLDIHPQPVHA
jgi:HPt (histidine-containing phosphotransfer) domain-containing protein